MSLRALTLAALAVSFAFGCNPDKASEEAAAPAPEAVAPAAVEPKAEEPPKADEEAAAEPEESPMRESLELLAKRGKAEVDSIRKERSSIYDLFARTESAYLAEIKGPVAQAQNLRWDERPEKLAAAPAAIHAAIVEIDKISRAFIDRATGKLTEGKKMTDEVASGAKKHSDKKIEKLNSEGSKEMKVGRYLGLLIRSLLDEARVYAVFGSTKLREEMRAMYGPLWKEPYPIDVTQQALHKLLYELKVEGVDAPSLD
jgi:hypothetical protein